MRSVIVITAMVLAAAGAPAFAQTFSQDPFAAAREDALRAEQDAARQREVIQRNELMALEARLRAEQAVLDLQIQRQRPVLPVPYAADRPAPQPTLSTEAPSIPDAALAASNARVRAAQEGR